MAEPAETAHNLNLRQSALRERLRHTARRFAYYAGSMSSQMHAGLWLVNALCGVLPDFGSGAIRSRLYRAVGLDVSPSTFIMGNLELLAGSLDSSYVNLHVGQHAVIGNHVTINLDAPVTIGNNVSLGPFVRIYTSTHQLGPGSNRRLPGVLAKPVVIEDGCWVGLGAMILPGVRLGHGSVVAAGAVVMQEVPPNTYVEGNPAQVVRQLPWGDR